MLERPSPHRHRCNAGGFPVPIQTDPIEIYITLAEDASTPDGTKPQTQQRGSHTLLGIGRLKPGVSGAQANAELRTLAAGLEKKYPETNTKWGAGLQPLSDELVGDVAGRPLRSLWRGRLRVADRERERRQSHAGARLRAAEGDRAASCAWGQSRTHHSAIADRKRVAGGRRRIAWFVDREMGNGCARPAVPQNIPRVSTNSIGWRRPRLHLLLSRRHRHCLRTRARLAGIARRSQYRVEGRRARQAAARRGSIACATRWSWRKWRSR